MKIPDLKKIIFNHKAFCFILCLLPSFVLSDNNILLLAVKSALIDSQCLVHIISTKMTNALSPNIHSLSKVIFLQTLYPHFEMNFTLCTSMAKKYEDPQNCTAVSAYNRQKLGNDCLLIFVQYSDNTIAPLKKIFLEMNLARNGILSPIFYIIVHSASIVEQIKLAALSKNVYMPPPKTIIIWWKLNPEWAYYCYFCREGGSVLNFSDFSSLPSAKMTRVVYAQNKLDSASNGHGHIATYQYFPVKLIWIQQCKEILLVTPRRRSECTYLVLLLIEASQKLNITFLEMDFMYEYDSTFDRALAFCESCHVFVPQDSSLGCPFYYNVQFMYCSHSLEMISISWHFLVEPFSLHIWLLLLLAIITFAISYKSLWAGMDVVWYIVAQNLQTKHPKIIVLVLWMLYVIGVAYTARFTSKVTSPLKPKLIETAKKLCEVKRIILPVGTSIFLLSKQAEFEKNMGKNMSTCILFSDSVVDWNSINVLGQLADENVASYLLLWPLLYIEKFIWNNTRCFSVRKDAVLISGWYSVRSYLAKAFSALRVAFENQGFGDIWVKESHFKSHLVQIRKFKEQGLSVDSLSMIPQPFKLSIKRSLVNVFHLLIAGCSLAFVTYAAEHTYHRNSCLCLVSIHSLKVWSLELRRCIPAVESILQSWNALF